MNLRDELLKEHSKKQTQFIAAWIGNNAERFNDLVQLFLANEYRVTQRAAWVVSNCVEAYPALLNPHLREFIENLSNTVHVAVKRNTFRILQFIDIPDELLGEIAAICFNSLEKKQDEIAIRVFAMSVLTNIAQREPELKQELRLLIEEQLPYEGPAFRARAKMELKRL